MNSSWLIDVVDSDKSMVRLRNSKTNLGKAYFFPRLKSAELKGTRLFASCDDAVWELDILTAVRKKMNTSALSEDKTTPSNSTAIQDIPYFLQKR